MGIYEHGHLSPALLGPNFYPRPSFLILVLRTFPVFVKCWGIVIKTYVLWKTYKSKVHREKLKRKSVFLAKCQDSLGIHKRSSWLDLSPLWVIWHGLSSRVEGEMIDIYVGPPCVLDLPGVIERREMSAVLHTLLALGTIIPTPSSSNIAILRGGQPSETLE